MREIVFDTETTGLDPLKGDRLIEIGCVELLNHVPTGRSFQRYINPRRAVALEAVAVHGLTDAFLAAHRFFEDEVEEFCEFVGDARLVAHNASFDRGFINMELGRVGRVHYAEERFLDTLALAKRRHPYTSNSLDALCLRYGIDNSRRTRHGALLDAEILAEVYLELLGGRQTTMSLGALDAQGITIAAGITARPLPVRPAPLAPRLTADDGNAHAAFVATLGPAPLWNRYRAAA